MGSIQPAVFASWALPTISQSKGVCNAVRLIVKLRSVSTESMLTYHS